MTLICAHIRPNNIALLLRITDTLDVKLYVFLCAFCLFACGNISVLPKNFEDAEIAEKNAETMRALIASREGDLQKIGEHLQVMHWLAVQAGKDSISDSRRLALNSEYSAHIAAIQTLIKDAKYNNLPPLDINAVGFSKNLSFKLQPDMPSLTIELNGLDSRRPFGFGPEENSTQPFELSINTFGGAQVSIEHIEKAMESLLYENMVLGGWYNRLEHAEKIIVMDKNSENVQDEIRYMESRLVHLATEAVQEFFTPDMRQGLQAQFSLLVEELQRTRTVYGQASRVITSLRPDENVLTIASAESLKQKLVSLIAESPTLQP